jgi:hypothetical protein
VFSCARCHQDIIQHGYKINAGQTLTYSKWLPNFRTGILLPETQGPQSCPLRVGKPSNIMLAIQILYACLYARRSNFVCKFVWDLHATNIWQFAWQFVRKFYMGVVLGGLSGKLTHKNSVPPEINPFTSL